MHNYHEIEYNSEDNKEHSFFDLVSNNSLSH